MSVQSGSGLGWILDISGVYLLCTAIVAGAEVGQQVLVGGVEADPRRPPTWGAWVT